MATKLQCEICGGKLVGKPGGIFECENCGTEYSTEWAKAKIQEITGTVKVDGTVEVHGTVKVENPITIDRTSSIGNLLKLGESALHDRRWEKALEYFERVLEVDSINAEALLGRYMAKNKQSDRLFFAEEYYNFRFKPFGLSIMGSDIAESRKNATGELKAWFDKLDDIAQKKNKEIIKKDALERHSRDKMINRFAEYKGHLRDALQGEKTSLETAVEYFKRDPNYFFCKEAERFCNQKLTNIDIVPALKSELKSIEQEKEIHKKQLMQYKAELSALGLFGKRDQKTSLREKIGHEEKAGEDINKKIDELRLKLSRLPESESIDRDLRALLFQTQIGELKNKSKIEIGSYFQDNSSKKTPISWTISTRIDGEEEILVSLISDKILDCAPKGIASGEWANSSLRKWLQNDFKREAFTQTEQAVISEIRLLKNEDEYWFPSHPTGMEIFSYSTAVVPTPYAVSRGTTRSTSNYGGRLGHGEWVQLAALPGYDRYSFQFRGADGKTTLESNLEGLPGIRPVIEISFKKNRM